MTTHPMRAGRQPAETPRAGVVGSHKILIGWKKDMDVKDRRASKLKWLREHTRKFTFLFRLDADAKVIEKLDSCENKTQYVRDLILKDIESA